ncbi:MAG: hypothetical protein Q9160_003282, partial [Pyrenula sp. 1 TL-2023]
FLETAWPELTFQYLELKGSLYEEWLNAPDDQTDFEAPIVKSSNGVITVPILSAFFEVQRTGEHGSKGEEALQMSDKFLMGESLNHGTHNEPFWTLSSQGPRRREGSKSQSDLMRRALPLTKGTSSDDEVNECVGQFIADESLDESLDDDSDSENLAQDASSRKKRSSRRLVGLGRSNTRTSRTDSTSARRKLSREKLMHFEEQVSHLQDDEAKRNPLCHVPRELVAKFFHYNDYFEFPKRGNDFTCNGKYASRQIDLPSGLSPLEIIKKWPNHLVGDTLVYIIDATPEDSRWGTSRIVKKLPNDFIQAWNNKPKKGQAARKNNGERVGMSNVFTHSLKSARKSVLNRMRKAGFLNVLDFEFDHEGGKVEPSRKPIQGAGNTSSKRRSFSGRVQREHFHPQRRLTDLYDLKESREAVQLRHAFVSSLPQNILTRPLPGRKSAAATHRDTIDRERYDDFEARPLGLAQSAREHRQNTAPGQTVTSKPQAHESSENFNTAAFTSAMTDYQLGESINRYFGMTNDSDISVNREGFDAAYPSANARGSNAVSRESGSMVKVTDDRHQGLDHHTAQLYDRYVWGFDLAHPYYDDYNQLVPERDPIFFQRRFMQPVESNFALIVNQIRDQNPQYRAPVPQEDLQDSPSDRGSELGLRQTGPGRQIPISPTRVRADQDSGNHLEILRKRQQASNRDRLIRLARFDKQPTRLNPLPANKAHLAMNVPSWNTASGGTNTSLGNSHPLPARMAHLAMNVPKRNTVSGATHTSPRNAQEEASRQAMVAYFRDKRWPEHLIPLAESLGRNLERVFAEDTRLRLTESEVCKILEEQVELREEEEPQLTDEEFSSLVDAADFNFS